MDISRIFILVEFSRILRLVESSRILGLVESGRFPRFHFGFRFRVVYYKAFLLIIGGGK